MSFEEFQDGHRGSHLGYWNGSISVILNLHVSPVPLIVSAKSHLPFRDRCHLKSFKMAAMVAILNIRTRTVLAVLNLHVALMPPAKFFLKLTYRLAGNVV